MSELEALLPVIQTAFFFGVGLAVVVAVARLGFALAPWIVGIAFLLYLFGG
jgi:hypothetical protein